MTHIEDQFLSALCNFADDITAKFSSIAHFSPEDQLKSPIEKLFATTAGLIGISLGFVTEVHVSELSARPDIGVLVNQLICGHVELKAPGKGADPKKFKGADKIQWNKFTDLPNLIYTDGNEWSLFRSVERVGAPVKLAGDVRQGNGSPDD